MTFRRLSTLCLAATLAVGAASTVRAAEQPTDDRLVQALQQGGLVIAFGQGPTTEAGATGSCPASGLSGHDRAEAEQLGAAFRRLQIPVGLVVTSRQCPTREAASVAFGLAIATADLEGPAAAERLRAHIGGPVPSGENRVLVTQTDVLRMATGLAPEDLAAGDAVVFAPQSDGSFRILSRVSSGGWTALAGGSRLQRRAGIG